MARHNALSDETKQAIALDYLAGMSQSKIAEKYGITYEQMREDNI